MGRMCHHGFLVSSLSGNDWIVRAQERARVIFGTTPVSPIADSPINHVRSFAIFPDGSKEGWAESDQGDLRRAEFKRYLAGLCYEDGSSSVDWVEVQYGDDDRVTKTCASSDDERKRAHEKEARPT